MTNWTDPTRVYVVTDFVVGFGFALAWTLLGLYYVQVAGLTPLQLLLIGAALEVVFSAALGQVSFGPLFGLIGNLSGVRVALALAALVRFPMLPIVARAGRKTDDE